MILFLFQHFNFVQSSDFGFGYLTKDNVNRLFFRFYIRKNIDFPCK